MPIIGRKVSGICIDLPPRPPMGHTSFFVFTGPGILKGVVCSCASKEHLVMFGDIFGYHNWRGMLLALSG